MSSFDSFQNRVLDHAKVKLPMSRNGENIEMTQLEIFLDMVFKHAAKGNPKAMGLYMAAQKEAADAKREFKEGILLAANEHIERWLHVFLLNERNGKPLPQLVYPDPRDIVINPDGSVDIVGPVNLQQQLDVEELMKLRDEYIESWDEFLTAGIFSEKNLEREWRKRSKHIEKWNSVIPSRWRKSLPPLSKYLAV